MKKKQLYNLLMVAAVVVIAAAGVLLAGHHLGWFDHSEEQSAVISLEKGIVYLTRDGLSTRLTEDTVLRSGDVISTSLSSHARITSGDSSLLLDESTDVILEELSQGTCSFSIAKGNVLCETAEQPIQFCLEDGNVLTSQQSSCLWSFQTGAVTLSVLRGTMNYSETEISSGRQLSLVTSCAPEISDLSADSLSSFALDNALLSAYSLCFTSEELQAVKDSRASSGDIASPDSVTGEDTSAETGTAEDISDGTKKDNSTANSSGSSTDSSSNTGSSDSKTSAVPSSGTSGSKKNDSSSTGSSDTSGSQNSGTSDSGSAGDTPSGGSCRISIRCDTILDNMDSLDPGLDVYVPDDGIILPTTTVSFSGGETVFDVLKRVCNQEGIQLEYSYTPGYGSYYIEGINHLYEFSCGQDSGWMFKVNGWFPNYGCSSYTLKDGDNIVWCYTCNGQGADVGGSAG